MTPAASLTTWLSSARTLERSTSMSTPTKINPPKASGFKSFAPFQVMSNGSSGDSHESRQTERIHRGTKLAASGLARKSTNCENSSGHEARCLGDSHESRQTARTYRDTKPSLSPWDSPESRQTAKTHRDTKRSSPPQVRYSIPSYDEYNINHSRWSSSVMKVEGRVQDSDA